MRKLAILTLLSIFGLILPASGQAALRAERAIYTDELASGWADWSWATVDLQASAPVHSGSHSIAVEFGAWEGLYLHHSGVSTTGYSHLRFYIHGGSSGGQVMNVFAHRLVNGSEEAGPVLPIPAPLAGQWSEVRLALADLQADDRTLTALTWQGALNNNQPVFYLDDIALVSDEDPDAPQLSLGWVAPRAIPADSATLSVAQVQVSDPQGLSDVRSVSLEGGPGGQVALHDDGRSNDAEAGDGLYGGTFAAPVGSSPGEYSLVARAVDAAGHEAVLYLGALLVLRSAGGLAPSALPQRIGWGSNSWDETLIGDWQVQSGVPWDYVYQYITYEWYLDGWGGNFVGRFVQQAWDKGFIPVVTVYNMLGLPPTCGEGGECYAQKLQNAGAVQDYLAAMALAAQQAAAGVAGHAAHGAVIFNLEPDFYGYMQQLSNSSSAPPGVVADDPASYPVALNIGGYPNTLAGFGRRMVDVVHANAPNALVGPMASMWATNGDPNSVTAEQAMQMGQRTAAFIDAMGGAQSDLLFVEWSDRDAGSGLRPWWDDTDGELPRPTRAILWENALSAASGMRLLLWQVPVGNMSLDNTCDHYQDNRAAYAFAHPRDLFDAGVMGVLFGGGATCMTSVETDGGFVAAQGEIAYSLPAAPQGLKAAPSGGLSVALSWQASVEPDLWGYRLNAQPQAGGPGFTRDASRRNALQLLLPQAGDWEFTVQAYDAMGQLSPASAPATVSVSGETWRLFLPAVGK